MHMKSVLLAGAAVAAFSVGTACTAALADGYSNTVAEHETAVERPAVVEHRTVVRRTIVRRPTVIERKTVVERPTVVERRTVVRQPIVERRIVIAPPIVERSVVVRRPVDVYDVGPPVVDAGPPPWAFDVDVDD